MKKDKITAINIIKGIPFFTAFIMLSILYFPIVIYKSIKHSSKNVETKSK